MHPGTHIGKHGIVYAFRKKESVGLPVYVWTVLCPSVLLSLVNKELCHPYLLAFLCRKGIVGAVPTVEMSSHYIKILAGFLIVEHWLMQVLREMYALRRNNLALYL